MNYLALKNMMETITKTYQCPDCAWIIEDSNIEIMWTAGNTININIFCPKCQNYNIMKAEVTYVWNKIINKQMIEKLQKEIIARKKVNSLKDKDITDLNNKLKNENLNISDLLWK